MNSQNVSNLAWSLAKLGIIDQPLLAAIASKAIALLQNASGQDLSNTAWAFAALSFDNYPLM
jgi:hypothetical protein